MYELAVERDFRAAHALTVAGRREQTHQHNWRVSVVVRGNRLDPDGLLCDFHVLQRKLAAVVDALRDRDLNTTPPFDRVNPTAENMARHVAEALAPALPAAVSLSRVSVTEAPGCTATYRPEQRG